MKQKTLKSELTFEGVGLHSGEKSKITLKPAPEDHGIVFRVDGVEIPAHVDFVSQVTRGTDLSRDGKTVKTVEHLLSALVGMQVYNVLIEVDGSEIPALDGSALPFAKAIEKIGLVEQGKEARIWKISKPFLKTFENARIAVHPDRELKISFAVDYQDDVIGRQFLGLPITPETYIREIAPAKTYVYERDVEELLKNGFSKGGSLENAIVYTDTGVKNPEIMTFPDEPVRHKILDLLGDLALLGTGYFQFFIYAERTGHRHHIEFIKELKSRVTYGKKLTIDDILKYIPHRYPFLLIDRVISLEDERVVAIKNVTYNEPFFVGHFPVEPVMPGVLIIEAIAQAGGFLLLTHIENREDKLVFFAGIDSARFRRPVKPGDQLEIEAILTRKRGSIVKFKGIARVDGQIVAEAELMASIVERSR